jgi:ferredoxin
MPYKIIDSCTACGLCLPACPIDAIATGDPVYVVDSDLCCDFEDCLAVCPVDAIVPAGVEELAVTERRMDDGYQQSAGHGYSESLGRSVPR